MLRLFLGLFLVLAIGLVAALEVVDRTFTAVLDDTLKTYNREAVRGQAYSLVEQLRALDGPGREAQLLALRPLPDHRQHVKLHWQEHVHLLMGTYRLVQLCRS